MYPDGPKALPPELGGGLILRGLMLLRLYFLK